MKFEKYYNFTSLSVSILYLHIKCMIAIMFFSQAEHYWTKLIRVLNKLHLERVRFHLFFQYIFKM